MSQVNHFELFIESVLPNQHSENIAAEAYEPHLLASARTPKREPLDDLIDFGKSIFGLDQQKPDVQERLPTAVIEHNKFFRGGRSSWVYRTVGVAEGNLEPNGAINKLSYDGHRDLNGKWNKGAFSNQIDRGATADQCDRLQLTRLEKNDQEISKLAKKYGLKLSTEERMNAIDLSNQSEEAVFSGWGYIERLSLAKSREGLVGNEAIAYARTWAFYNPSASAWQAAVFNNDPSRIEADQRRRMSAIANTLVLLRAGK
jgi:hypothetical protein